jgi:DNA-binding CsgD family transcriptional regulator
MNRETAPIAKRFRRSPNSAALVPALLPSRASPFQLGDDDYVVFVMPSVEALTCAEEQVVRLIVEGRSNDEIARVRRTATRTVANQVAHIFRKLGVDRRAELVALMTSGASPNGQS